MSEAAASSAGALTVSVALCTYNGERFVREQVRSICLQTRPPMEIVLSDDASRDACVEVARATVEECLRERPGLAIALRVIVNPVGLRVVKNFEQAVRACGGTLIALSDQDDAWVPERLERLVAEFERRPELRLLHSDARLVDAEGAPLGGTLFHAIEVTAGELERMHAGQAFDVLLRRNIVTGATTVFHRELLDAVLPFPVEWVHDEWIATVASAFARIDTVEAQLIDYRQHGGNQIGARRDTFMEKVRKALASRGTTHVERARKAELLLERLEQVARAGRPVTADTLDKLRGKIVHQRFRTQLPASRWARVLPILREARTGRYDRFGRGFRGVVRDLFESV